MLDYPIIEQAIQLLDEDYCVSAMPADADFLGRRGCGCCILIPDGLDAKLNYKPHSYLPARPVSESTVVTHVSGGPPRAVPTSDAATSSTARQLLQQIPVHIIANMKIIITALPSLLMPPCRWQALYTCRQLGAQRLMSVCYTPAESLSKLHNTIL